MNAANTLRCAVVLCSWNGERFLSQQLDSLRAQTQHIDQYVLSDDGSSDGSWALLQAFADERRAAGADVILHRNPQALGYVRHFEQALARADADVLFTCDQDDAWHPDKVSKMMEMFVADPSLLVLHSDARLVDDAGTPMGRTLFDVLEVTRRELRQMHRGDAFHVLLRRNIVTGATMALRRTVVALASPFATHWAHDEWMAMVAAMHGRVDTLERALIDYRQHSGNQIGAAAKTPLQQVGIGVSRQSYQQRQVLRLRELERCAAPSGAVHDSIADRLRHAEVRANLPSTPFARLAHVTREVGRGGYHRFGSGLRSALADLLGLD
ncbi:glycosyltransferase family 2 protein [Solilutibacter silvestris]|uniref:Glycosyl transferase family 2 n=1 Tax=Solilutibacter silvestris TaxID=1645665 RepID=A0A2K1PXG5_9GAMM|nr:glycosyltransferase family 2 protein [Lysobacter silvestris]PNS07471.1 Glycosyl transferase family 2 [Lysobacter silvestris]